MWRRSGACSTWRSRGRVGMRRSSPAPGRARSWPSSPPSRRPTRPNVGSSRRTAPSPSPWPGPLDPRGADDPAAGLDAEGQQRFEALRELRGELRDGKPAYVVFDNKTLVAIAREAPTSLRELGPDLRCRSRETRTLRRPRDRADGPPHVDLTPEVAPGPGPPPKMRGLSRSAQRRTHFRRYGRRDEAHGATAGRCAGSRATVRA